MYTFQGLILVSAPGEITKENEFIIDTVFAHLPRLIKTDFDELLWHINYSSMGGSESTFDPLTDESWRLGKKLFRHEHTFLVTLSGSFMSMPTKKEVYKWLIRLAKRLTILNVFLEIGDFRDSYVIHQSDNTCNLWKLYERRGNWIDKLIPQYRKEQRDIDRRHREQERKKKRKQAYIQRQNATT